MRRDELIPPQTIIAGEIRKDIRFKPYIDLTSLLDSGNYVSVGSMPSGRLGYDVSAFESGGAPSNLVDNRYYEVKTSTVGMWDIDSFSDAISNAITSADGSQFNMGAISLDGLFVPYTTSSSPGSGLLPHFEYPSGVVDEQNSRTLNPFNPLNMIPIESGDQMASGNVGSGMPSGIEGYWLKYGHNIAMALSSDLLLDSGVEDFNFEEDYWSRGKVELSGIRSIAHRSPMVLSGWGYDTDGDPVPALSGEFHPELPYNSSLGKTGPVDLRWDNDRKVWTGGNTTRVFLSKITNVYTPKSFSFEVDRSNSRSQYTRNAPPTKKAYTVDQDVYDAEQLAYDANSSNVGAYEQLDYSSLEFPYYEAFVIRETKDVIDETYYNIWTEDCQDCGHVTNPCAQTPVTKILIENPLRQSLDIGDLAFTIRTGRKKKVATSDFTGGDGVEASGQLCIDASGNASFNVTSAGSGYTYGGFAILDDCDICANLSLTFEGGVLSTGVVTPSGGFSDVGTCCDLSIYPANASVGYESLDVHWIMQAEFKQQQVVTHVACDNGVLQSCSMKIQTQGYKTCEWCGEDTTLIN